MHPGVANGPATRAHVGAGLPSDRAGRRPGRGAGDHAVDGLESGVVTYLTLHTCLPASPLGPAHGLSSPKVPILPFPENRVLRPSSHGIAITPPTASNRTKGPMRRRQANVRSGDSSRRSRISLGAGGVGRSWSGRFRSCLHRLQRQAV